jgi:DNA-binding transcriptional regulator YiaG
MRISRRKLSRAGKAGKLPKTPVVTASRFRDTRLVCRLTIPSAAKLLRVTERTVQNWESGKVRIPYAAFKLMRILRGYELPDPAWRGFRVVGATLWTPEGHAFRPDHMTWWSLTCRMADEFRQRALRRRAVAAVVRWAQDDAMSDRAPAGLVATGTSDTRELVPSANRGLKAVSWHHNDADLHQDPELFPGFDRWKGSACPGSNTGQKAVSP